MTPFHVRDTRVDVLFLFRSQSPMVCRSKFSLLFCGLLGLGVSDSLQFNESKKIVGQQTTETRVFTIHSLAFYIVFFSLFVDDGQTGRL